VHTRRLAAGDIICNACGVILQSTAEVYDEDIEDYSLNGDEVVEDLIIDLRGRVARLEAQLKQLAGAKPVVTHENGHRNGHQAEPIKALLG
jgi:hypothetical protein